MDAIMKRRSIRKFQDKPVEPEKIENILRAAMQSPTGINAQDWEFLIIKDRDTILKISQMSEVTVSAKNAPMLIVPLANLQRAKGGNLLWSCDMGAVTQTILIQIEEEGLGGVWLSVWPYEERVNYLKELLHLPEHIIPFVVIPVGYKLAEKPFDDRYDPEKVHWEKY